MNFLFSACIIIRYNHNHITKLVTFPQRGGGSCPCLFDFKILFAIIIIFANCYSTVNIGKCKQQVTELLLHMNFA
jgi:hypothetical protein